jgi:hypothetical protein
VVVGTNLCPAVIELRFPGRPTRSLITRLTDMLGLHNLADSWMTT